MFFMVNIKNGYDLMYNVWKKEKEHDITELMLFYNKKEAPELEFKATFYPDESELKEKGNSNVSYVIEGCKWNIVSSTIAIANAYGGCILLGIDDHGNFVENYRKGENLDQFERKLIDIFNKSEWKDEKGKIITLAKEKDKELLKDCFTIKEAKFKGNDIVLILIKPIEPTKAAEKAEDETPNNDLIICNVRGKNETKGYDTLYYRITKHDTGFRESTTSWDDMSTYIKNRKKNFSLFRENIQDKYYRIYPGEKYKIQFQNIIGLILLLSFTVLIGILAPYVIVAIGGCLAFSALLAVYLNRSPETQKIGMTKLPEDIDIYSLTDSSPWMWKWCNIPWPCQDGGIWWSTVDSCKSCYGTWKLQQHVWTKSYRILDPRHIRRCWQAFWGVYFFRGKEKINAAFNLCFSMYSMHYMNDELTITLA